MHNSGLWSQSDIEMVSDAIRGAPNICRRDCMVQKVEDSFDVQDYLLNLFVARLSQQKRSKRRAYLKLAVNVYILNSPIMHIRKFFKNLLKYRSIKI